MQKVLQNVCRQKISISIKTHQALFEVYMKYDFN